ncbi:MAG: homoserine O-acetyltransferase [Solirubrobacterales bacterium]|nr:homoserine O-acetyltransferase [Solirubrobacterales bacterium]
MSAGRETAALGPFRLASGAVLAELQVAFEQWGRPDGRNTVVVCHALTGDAHVTGEDGWWTTMVGPGRPVDTDRFHVVCANLLGGCQGTTGPQMTNPATGQAYGLGFPLVTVGDQVQLHRRLLAHLGIDAPLAAVGGSLGGMQALEWSLAHPGELAGAAIIAASGALSAQNLALSTVAREAILRDPAFRGGDYARHGVRPDDGLSIARMLGHVTYLSDDGMQERFGRERVAGTEITLRGPSFEVERYLFHQAERFLERFDANAYLHLSRCMDGFDAFGDGDARARAAAAAGTRHLVVSFDSDWRFSTAHSTAIAGHLGAAGAHVEHLDVPSSWGHDSFLLDLPPYLDAVAAFLEGLAAQ